MSPFLRQVTFYLVIALVVVVILSLATNEKPPEKIDFNPTFIKQVQTGQVDKVFTRGNEVEAELKDGRTVKTYRPDDFNLTTFLIENNVQYDPNPPEGPKFWQTALTYMIPFLLLIGIFFFFMQQTQGGGNRVMNFGKSRARLHEGDRKKVTFNEVAGADEEKAELAEVVDFLKDPRKYIELGARIPKGILLVGPPGTGKTLLARAVAGEAGVPFFSISGSDFVEMFVGVGASRVRDLFENAKKSSPCIVFIDEIDAVGRQRGAGLGGGHDEREQTLNQLLVEMDGFDVNEGIIIIAATNRPDILDPALLRPGRFDREITVGFPDVKGREEILKVHSRNKPLAEEVDLQVIARGTPGFTGADLENVVNEAALLTARVNRKRISMHEMEEAIERVIAGTEKRSRVISESEKKIVAFHEAGHALVGYLLPHTDPVHKVSIIPRGRAGGYTLMFPKEDRYYMTRSELLDRVSTLMAGRAAEKLALNEISTGAQNDLERATAVVRQMIMEYGMSEALGPITLGKKHDQVFLGRDLGRDRDFSEEIAKAIDQEIRRTIDECYRKAQETLEQNRDKLDLIAQVLLDKETLDAEEIKALMNGQSLEELEALRREKNKNKLEQEDLTAGKAVESGKQTDGGEEQSKAEEAPEGTAVKARVSYQQRTDQVNKPKKEH
ncbi:MAG: ATP-dependent zinc metalloprotease FtsH [Bacillota bacterium]